MDLTIPQRQAAEALGEALPHRMDLWWRAANYLLRSGEKPGNCRPGRPEGAGFGARALMRGVVGSLR